jgi:MarR family transcriptional regulator, 2-MHQ and catechol-resistance regulon repressor
MLARSEAMSAISSPLSSAKACLDGIVSMIRFLTNMRQPASRGSGTSRDDSAETELDRAATLQLVITLGRAIQAIEKGVRPHLASHGLAMTEFAVLEVLYHKGALPLGEIRDRILVTGASTTYVVNKLEERGLMRRRGSGEDKRVIFGEITPAGRKLMAGIFPDHVEQLRTLMAGLSPVEKRTAAQLVRKLAQHASAVNGSPSSE